MVTRAAGRRVTTLCVAPAQTSTPPRGPGLPTVTRRHRIPSPPSLLSRRGQHEERPPAHRRDRAEAIPCIEVVALADDRRDEEIHAAIGRPCHIDAPVLRAAPLEQPHHASRSRGEEL